MLAESRGHDAFGSLAEAPREVHAGGGGWRVGRLPDDPGALRLSHDDGRDVLLLAGRQILTRERIEVLALGTRARFPDGEPAETTLTRIRERGALAVLAWGVGKWLGRRGRLTRELIGSHDDVMIADNAGRPPLWPRGTLFALAGRLGRPILSGSDPLDIPGAERTVGRAGFVVDGAISMRRPTEWLASAIRAAPIAAFGRREGALRFIRNQWWIRRRPSGR